MSAQDIADVSGVSVTLVRRLLRPQGVRPVRVSRTTADAVLGVPLLPAQHTVVGAAGRPGLTGAHRAAGLLVELAERGWRAEYLAGRLGVSSRTVAAVRDGTRSRLGIALDLRIRHLYTELAATTPAAAGIPVADAARTRTWALRRRGG
ncbi:hypothetical protein AB0442_38955 [Kitasatospora sp. NPDC085895]|uniref:hypothetical protein n=1 Tax=Kitasatospora sp. NPDC085895 TaxID=3155057 RepID=UPI0034503960